MKTTVFALAAALGLALMSASCTRGQTATASGPSAKEIAACAPIMNFKLPPVRQGAGLGIALPAKQVEKLIESGNPTLAQNGRVFTNGGDNGKVYVNAFLRAQAECRKIGA
jgi:hypothetical protein